jgi:transposase-like protein
MANPIVRGLTDYGEVCPRCYLARVVRLNCMTRYSSLHWFKCEGCDHIFTRTPEEPASQTVESGSGVLTSW